MERKPGALRIAAVYVGTVVGAGFATGQEILQFFTYFGLRGLVAQVLATGLFALFGVIVLDMGRKLQAQSHQPLIERAGGEWLGGAIDWLITFFLFGALAVMIAGSGAVFAEQFHLPRLLGTVAMALAAGATVLLGLRGVVAAISAVAPVLVVSVLGISLYTLFSQGLAPGALAFFAPARAATPWWPVSALLYVSYNLVLAISVLGPLGAAAAAPRHLRLGGLLGGLTLGLSAVAINLGLLAGLPETAAYEVPMLELVRRFPPAIQFGYSLVLWAEVYTTAVGSLYGLAARLVGPGTARYRRFVIGASLAALGAGQVGFSKMVGVLFPLVGYAGLTLLGGLLWAAWTDRRPAPGEGPAGPETEEGTVQT